MILAVESKRGHSSKTQVLAQEDVLHRVTEHRLHELRSSNPDLCTFADYISMTEGTWTQVASARKGDQNLSPLELYPVKAKHSELCYGCLVREKETKKVIVDGLVREVF